MDDWTEESEYDPVKSLLDTAAYLVGEGGNDIEPTAEWLQGALTQYVDPHAARAIVDEFFMRRGAYIHPRPDDPIGDWETEGGQKQAASGPYYHAAPTEDRNRIQTWGLIPGNPQATWKDTFGQGFGQGQMGVYMHPDPSKTMSLHSEAHDIWAIDPSYVNNPIPDRLAWGAVIAPHPIPPEALTLHQKADDKMWRQNQPDPNEHVWERAQLNRNRDEWGIGQPTAALNDTWWGDEGYQKCPHCGQGFVDYSKFWKPITDGALGEAIKVCPNCQTDLWLPENRPVEKYSAQSELVNPEEVAAQYGYKGDDPNAHYTEMDMPPLYLNVDSEQLGRRSFPTSYSHSWGHYWDPYEHYGDYGNTDGTESIYYTHKPPAGFEVISKKDEELPEYETEERHGLYCDMTIYKEKKEKKAAIKRIAYGEGDTSWANIVPPVPSENVGVRTGDPSITEHLGQSSGSRGTGHFGTGIYFASSPEAVGGANHYGIDLTGYNLYRPRSFDAAMKLHDALRNINTLASNPPGGGIPSTTRTSDPDEFAIDLSRISIPEYHRNEPVVRQAIDSARADIAKVGHPAGYPHPDFKQYDSASTRVMKGLGYHGIDTRHIPGMDNLMYGSVLYRPDMQVQGKWSAYTQEDIGDYACPECNGLGSLRRDTPIEDIMGERTPTDLQGVNVPLITCNHCQGSGMNPEHLGEYPLPVSPQGSEHGMFPGLNGAPPSIPRSSPQEIYETAAPTMPPQWGNGQPNQWYVDPEWDLGPVRHGAVKKSSKGHDFSLYTHYNGWTGKPCNCAWGQPKKRHKRRTSSQNLRMVRNQNQKHFRDEAGQDYLNRLGQYAEKYPQIEGMVPWLASRYKHGDIVPSEDWLLEDDPLFTPNSWTDEEDNGSTWQDYMPPTTLSARQSSSMWTNYDPLICGSCGHQMSEPRLLNGRWMNTCPNCRANRLIPPESPLLKEFQQGWSDYPDLLKEVNTPMTWSEIISTVKTGSLMTGFHGVDTNEEAARIQANGFTHQQFPYGVYGYTHEAMQMGYKHGVVQIPIEANLTNPLRGTRREIGYQVDRLKAKFKTDDDSSAMIQGGFDGFITNRGRFFLVDPRQVQVATTKRAKVATLDPDYEIRPADEGWFSHDTARFIPRFDSKGNDTLATDHGQGQGQVAYYQGQPVASVTWQEIPDWGYMLGSAYTDPAHRGKGLFNALTEQLRSSGCPVDAYHWENPWLKNKVRDWQRTSQKTATIFPGHPFSRIQFLAYGQKQSSKDRQVVYDLEDDIFFVGQSGEKYSHIGDDPIWGNYRYIPGVVNKNAILWQKPQVIPNEWEILEWLDSPTDNR